MNSIFFKEVYSKVLSTKFEDGNVIVTTRDEEYTFSGEDCNGWDLCFIKDSMELFFNINRLTMVSKEECYNLEDGGLSLIQDWINEASEYVYSYFNNYNHK